ncbi:MAG: hypothetical protein LIO94_12965 [Clostridiales bacterium]|nr:hypothetical protein [Clostridiales bacterium]
MRNRNTILNLLIIIEAAVLVVVLVVGLLHTGISHLPGRRAENLNEADMAVAADEQNAVDIAAVTETEEETVLEEETEEADDNSITDSGSAYEALVFSDEVTARMDAMTTEQKVAQLFVTTPEELTDSDQVTLAGETTRSAVTEYPVGGLVYSAENIQGASQVDSLVRNTQEYMEDVVGVPMFAMIEEIGGNDHSPLAAVDTTLTVTESPAELGAEGDPNQITEAAQTRAEAVLSNGFNTILGPVADVSTEGSQPDFDDMTYGTSTGNVADCVEYDIEGLQGAGVMAVMRAFPGTYDVTTDYSAYQMGIDAGVDCIMVSNQPDSSLTGNGDMPCSISIQVVQKLRQEMGFEGLLMTSNLASGVVTSGYNTADAAVEAVCAGMDLIYVRGDFDAAYEAVLSAVEDGTISENMLNNAVGRILTEKID